MLELALEVPFSLAHICNRMDGAEDVLGEKGQERQQRRRTSLENSLAGFENFTQLL